MIKAEKEPAIEVEIESGDSEVDEGSAKKMDEFEIKRCCDVILEAEMLKQDDAKMAQLKPYLAKKSKALASFDDVRAVAKKKLAKY